MRLFWLIGAIAFAPAAHAEEKSPTLGVGELSCSKEIADAVCGKLTEKLVTTLEGQSPFPVVRQADDRKKQRACEQDPACMGKHRPSYARIVTGSVRGAEDGVEINLRLLDARRMETLTEANALVPSSRESELLDGVAKAAAELVSAQARSP